MDIDIMPPEETHKLQENRMLQKTEVDKIFSLKACGWGAKRISNELGISRRIVKKYIRLGTWQPPSKRVVGKLLGLESWLKDCFEKHLGNADVIRQQLLVEHDIKVSLRTVERAVQEWRQEALVKAKATIRFETPPGKQLQIDFGSVHIDIGGIRTRVYLFVATLGYSRRLYVAPFLHERQNVWFQGLEGAFSHFRGVPEQVLMDNAKALVKTRNPDSKEAVFNDRLNAFAQYWGFKPKACAPYRARTKGKDERMVGYVKRNAIAGHTFPHWESLKQHLEQWNTTIADVRIHGTTEEKPLERFLRDEASMLQPLPNKPPFVQVREFCRKVHVDACIEIETNHYSVPNHLVDKVVFAQLVDSELKIYHNDQEVASHAMVEGRRQRVIEANHLQGIVGAPSKKLVDMPSERSQSEMLRPLAEYEAVAGGGW